MPLPLALFGDIAFQELLLVAVAAVVIFGRRLPEVAGQTFAQFQRVRRTLTRMWRETGIDEELRKVQRDIERKMPRDLGVSGPARRAPSSTVSRALPPRPAPVQEERAPKPQTELTEPASTAGAPSSTAAEREDAP